MLKVIRDWSEITSLNKSESRQLSVLEWMKDKDNLQGHLVLPLRIVRAHHRVPWVQLLVCEAYWG